MTKAVAFLMLAVPAVCFSATYHEVDQAGGTPSVEVTSVGQTGCVYAGEPIALGDTVTHPDGSLQVCASGSRGPVFMTVNAEPNSASYKIVMPAPPPFVPTKVWDDGKFTYIQLPAPYHGDLPAVFEVLDDGKLAVVDARWDGDTSRFVARKVVDHVQLRLDDIHVEIDRSRV